MSGTVVEKKEIRLHGRKVVYRASQPAANRGIVVLLHGYSFNSAIWDGSGVFSALNSVGLGAVAPDYPGFGESEEIQEFKVERGDLKASGAFIEEFSDALGLERYHLLGASMGGGMALLTALMHPHEVLSVVAAAPAWVKDREREMERIQCPVLLIWGSADSVVPLQDGVAYSRRIKGCKLEVIQGAGHPSYLDAPERFAEVLKGFYSTLVSRQKPTTE
ncbi:alpha/beta fold hydrolase [Thermogymnomonas acidicola]|nr:alpha/beta hydrolase [Thermogymnomonas acidicola]